MRKSESQSQCCAQQAHETQCFHEHVLPPGSGQYYPGSWAATRSLRNSDAKQRSPAWRAPQRPRTHRINTWDLVDRAAPYVVGGYLWDKSREPLYRLAGSAQWYERRSSIVSTWFFIRHDDLDDTFRIAQILVNDPHDLVQKAVGGWIREAGKRDEQRLHSYLDRNAATMPRTTLRYAIEQLPPEVRDHYLDLKAG
jgi:hypothetical protein